MLASIAAPTVAPAPATSVPPYALEWMNNPFGGDPPGRFIEYRLKAGEVLATGAAGQATMGTRSWTLESTATTDAVAAARQLLEQDASLQAVAWAPIPTRAPQSAPSSMHLFEVAASAGTDVAASLEDGSLVLEPKSVIVTTEGGSEGMYHVHAAHGIVTRDASHAVADTAPKYEPPLPRGDYGGW